MAKKQKKYTPEGKKASLAVKYAATFPRLELIFVTSAFQSVTQCCTFAMMSSGRSPAARLFAGAFFVCVPVAIAIGWRDLDNAAIGSEPERHREATPKSGEQKEGTEALIEDMSH